MKEETKWELKGFIEASKYRKLVLKALNEKEKTPTELAKELNLKLSHISRTLKELQEKKLVECLNPNARKSRYYKSNKIVI